MDADSAASTKLLESIAGSNEQFIALSQWLRSLPEIKVTRGFECRAYKSGTMIEAYVEAEVDENKTVCWWLDVGWNNEQWLIESSVLLNDDQGQKVLRTFPTRTARSLDDFVTQLAEATEDLTTHARSMDLSVVHPSL